MCTSRRGFTLLEVLIAVGVLASLGFVVASTFLSAHREIYRHNAQMYANLIAEQQFSALVAYRNHLAFDGDKSTTWETIKSQLAQGGHFEIRGNVLTWDNATGERQVQVGEKDKPHFLPLHFRLTKVGGGDEDKELKVELRVWWTDRGKTKEKKFYTILGNYLW
ncbi:prepilin-type N-terminal cleavage/methylation domain-containing protein [bacterium]|nr:prepilin-type N-terminal cleavage/methylation domain-containing protein [bacterium]